MDKITLMTVKLFAPAGTMFLGSVVLMLVGWNMATHPLLPGLLIVWERLIGLVTLVGLGLWVYGAVRLWQWHQGRSFDCPNCGGLLGSEREGRHGSYRRCLACEKNVSRNKYA
jgi:hypothetical protein